MTKQKWINAGVITFLVLLYIYYNIYSNNQFEKYGVYTIAKITKWESAEQGSDLYYDVIFNGKTYSCHSDGGYVNKIGKFYYIKVLSFDPTRSQGPLDVEVPDCVLKKGVPEGGWRKIPKCED